MLESPRPDVWHLCEDVNNAVRSLLDSFFKDMTHSCAQSDLDWLENQELRVSLKLTALLACLDDVKRDYSAIQEKKQVRLRINRRLPSLPAETIVHILHLTCLGDRMPRLECIYDVKTEWFATIKEALRPRADIKYMFLSITTLELDIRDYFRRSEEEALPRDIIATYPAKLALTFDLSLPDDEWKQHSRQIEVLLQHSDRLRSLSIYCESINGENALKQCMRLLPYVKDFRLDVDPDDDWSFVTNDMSHLRHASVPSSFLASITCVHNFNTLTDLVLDLSDHSGKVGPDGMEQHFSALSFLPNLRSLTLGLGWGGWRDYLVISPEVDASPIMLPSLMSLRLEKIRPSASEALLAFFRKCRIQELALIGDSDGPLSEVLHFDFRRLGELFPQLTSLESNWHSDTVVTALSEPEDNGVWIFPALQTLCLRDPIVDTSALFAMLHSRHSIKEVVAIREITVRSVVDKDIPEAGHLLLYELNKLVPCAVIKLVPCVVNDFYDTSDEDEEYEE